MAAVRATNSALAETSLDYTASMTTFVQSMIANYTDANGVNKKETNFSIKDDQSSAVLAANTSIQNQIAINDSLQVNISSLSTQLQDATSINDKVGALISLHSFASGANTTQAVSAQKLEVTVKTDNTATKAYK